jgi:hypothetical protein
MGKTVHKSLVVTGSFEHFANAYNRALELFKIDNDGNEMNMVSGILDKGINQCKTFIIAPDGSYEGYPTSDFFDAKMNIMIDYLKSRDCIYDEDSSSSIKWILVEYGDTGSRILKSNCQDLYNEGKIS